MACFLRPIAAAALSSRPPPGGRHLGDCQALDQAMAGKLWRASYGGQAGAEGDGGAGAGSQVQAAPQTGAPAPVRGPARLRGRRTPTCLQGVPADYPGSADPRSPGTRSSDPATRAARLQTAATPAMIIAANGPPTQ